MSNRGVSEHGRNMERAITGCVRSRDAYDPSVLAVAAAALAASRSVERPPATAGLRHDHEQPKSPVQLQTTEEASSALTLAKGHADPF